jgi:DNA invertase Pin-like site-specific DNA recombinase
MPLARLATLPLLPERCTDLRNQRQAGLYMVRETVPSQKFVAYERVSTARQGRSGLGLEAQRKAIDDFASSRGADVLARFTEVESGRRNERPELAKALTLAKLTGATLVIAKLDWISRNAAFLLTLRDSGARFLACDMPEANDLTVGIMALVAQQEREAISRRTKEALAAAKARGVKLGNPNGAAALRRAGKGGVALRAAARANADAFAQALAPVLVDLQTDRDMTLREIAANLNGRGIRTRRNGRWHVSNVRNLLARLRGGQIEGGGNLTVPERGDRPWRVTST